MSLTSHWFLLSELIVAIPDAHNIPLTSTEPLTMSRKSILNILFPNPRATILLVLQGIVNPPLPSDLAPGICL
jgi:hypothetical protein